jgi:hypothetical protein
VNVSMPQKKYSQKRLSISFLVETVERFSYPYPIRYASCTTQALYPVPGLILERYAWFDMTSIDPLYCDSTTVE